MRETRAAFATPSTLWSPMARAVGLGPAPRDAGRDRGWAPGGGIGDPGPRSGSGWGGRWLCACVR